MTSPNFYLLLGNIFPLDIINLINIELFEIAKIYHKKRFQPTIDYFNGRFYQKKLENDSREMKFFYSKILPEYQEKYGYWPYRYGSDYLKMTKGIFPFPVMWSFDEWKWRKVAWKRIFEYILLRRDYHLGPQSLCFKHGRYLLLH